MIMNDVEGLSLKGFEVRGGRLAKALLEDRKEGTDDGVWGNYASGGG
jgi:hypothetical protein